VKESKRALRKGPKNKKNNGVGERKAGKGHNQSGLTGSRGERWGKKGAGQGELRTKARSAVKNRSFRGYEAVNSLRATNRSRQKGQGRRTGSAERKRGEKGVISEKGRGFLRRAGKKEANRRNHLILAKRKKERGGGGLKDLLKDGRT